MSPVGLIAAVVVAAAATAWAQDERCSEVVEGSRGFLKGLSLGGRPAASAPVEPARNETQAPPVAIVEKQPPSAAAPPATVSPSPAPVSQPTRATATPGVTITVTVRPRTIEPQTVQSQVASLPSCFDYSFRFTLTFKAEDVVARVDGNPPFYGSNPAAAREIPPFDEDFYVRVSRRDAKEAMQVAVDGISHTTTMTRGVFSIEGGNPSTLIQGGLTEDGKIGISAIRRVVDLNGRRVKYVGRGPRQEFR